MKSIYICMIETKKISKTFSVLSAKLLKKPHLHIYIYIYIYQWNLFVFLL